MKKEYDFSKLKENSGHATGLIQTLCNPAEGFLAVQALFPGGIDTTLTAVPS